MNRVLAGRVECRLDLFIGKIVAPSKVEPAFHPPGEDVVSPNAAAPESANRLITRHQGQIQAVSQGDNQAVSRITMLPHQIDGSDRETLVDRLNSDAHPLKIR